MGIYIPWLAEAGLMTGYPVIEIGGWRNRGHGGFRVVEGVVCHHTAGSSKGNYPSQNIVTNGRAGLKGPLCNYGLARDGSIVVVAAGVGYHAGASQWAGFRDLNDEFIGIEAESVGTRDDWTPQQRDAYPRLCAAICYFIRRGADRVCAHRECCIPKGRKPDPAFWDMNRQIREPVAWMLQDPRRINRFGGGKPSGPTTPVSKKRKKLPDMIERRLVHGPNVGRIVTPTGADSAISKRVWVSVSAQGGASGRIMFQNNADSDVAPPGTGPIWEFKARNANKLSKELPDKTDFIEYQINCGGEGSLLVEFEPE